MQLNYLAGLFIKWFFRTWVRLFGRKIKKSELGWLSGPIGTRDKIGPSIYTNVLADYDLDHDINKADTGLMEDFAELASASFDPNLINPRVRDFYERTTNYKLDVWSHWSALFKPLGWLLVSTVSRRIEQLNFPVSPLDTSRGMSSDVIRMRDKTTSKQIFTCWLRRVVETGDVVYAGFYSTCRPPKSSGECVRVAFPLPLGNATVILKPIALEDGSLELRSSGCGFGDAGYYRVLQVDDDTVKVRLIRALKESIHVYVDGSGILRTDHVFKFWTIVMLRLHYKIVSI